ncbi:MAG: hypothetical protein H6Q74_846 [Firmicutes bacterium]|nr:hypothetical protein [Bacillota bacterium]
MEIAENLKMITNNVSAALARRRAEVMGTGHEVKLVAVTKNHDALTVRAAIDAGVRSIGENRVQEALSKAEVLERNAEWHLIGHLQTNKVRQAVPQFALIHSVDSERLAVEIDRAAGKIGKCQDILLQVNPAGEDTKFGLATAELQIVAEQVSALANVRLCGLMTIAPHYDNPEATRIVFKKTYELFMELKAAKLPNTAIEWLSMGMTNDYTVAVEEGANLIRVGTGIFGLRDYNKEV